MTTTAAVLTDDERHRMELRAYQRSNTCRAAALIAELSATNPGRPLHRQDIQRRWAQRWPRHARSTGRRSIRNRLDIALGLLHFAGIIEANDTRVQVVHAERLAMVVRNLDIVQDDPGGGGAAIPAANWARRPEVPHHLRAVQNRLQDTREADTRRGGN